MSSGVLDAMWHRPGWGGAHLHSQHLVLHQHRANPAVPAEVTANATVELAAGIPFVSDADLQTALDDAGVPAATADAIVDENATARIDALRASLSVLAVIALIALFFTRRIPTRQPASAPVT